MLQVNLSVVDTGTIHPECNKLVTSVCVRKKGTGQLKLNDY